MTDSDVLAICRSLVLQRDSTGHETRCYTILSTEYVHVMFSFVSTFWRVGKA